MTKAQIEGVVKPMLDELDAEGIPYSTWSKEYSSFYDLYIDAFEDEVSGMSALIGGRLYTQKDMTQNAAGVNAAQRFAAENGGFIIGHVVGPGVGMPSADNAVNPKWREAASFSIMSYTIEGNATLQDKATAQNLVTNVIGQKLRDASPNGAAYVNEVSFPEFYCTPPIANSIVSSKGDLEEPNWQEAYWGSNYRRLYFLKKLWDPLGVFYARTTPGTEDWEIIDNGTRLCKKLF
jgi:hypothetical protein